MTKTTKTPSADEVMRTNRKRLTYLNQRIAEAVTELAKLRDEQKTVKAKLIATK